MKSIREVENLDGVRVLVRLDLNVPIQNGIITDDFRLRKSLPLLKYLLEKGALLILISHIETKDTPTLKPVAEYFMKVGIDCVFEKNYKKALGTANRVTLLENLRNHEGEKKNDRKFAKELASLADIYVNEAFSVSHREHASVCAITEFIPSYAGFQFMEEIKHLSSAFSPSHPFLFILGGAKFETKLPLVEKFMKIADMVFIGGALANDFFKEQGRDIGTSMVSESKPDLSKFIHDEKLLLPADSILKDTAIMDAGTKTVEMLRLEIEKAKFVLWNGPLGAYETGYKAATLQLAELLADATNNGLKTIVGGGDTLATIRELDLENSFTFVSTGGGAMLEYLAKGTLPGIEALEKSRGFTLIELLVVISIIAVISSVVFAVFGDTKVVARDSQRMQQIEQIDLAVRLYKDDKNHAPDLQGTCSVSNYTNASNCIAVSNEPSGTPNDQAWDKFKDDISPYMKSVPDDPCGTNCSINGLPLAYSYTPPAVMKSVCNSLSCTQKDEELDQSYHLCANLERNPGTCSGHVFLDHIDSPMQVAGDMTIIGAGFSLVNNTITITPVGGGPPVVVSNVLPACLLFSCIQFLSPLSPGDYSVTITNEYGVKSNAFSVTVTP